MAKINILLSFIPLLFITAMAASSVVSNNFINASCSATTYPAVCIESLSLYANTIQQSPHQLALTALNVSIDRAQSTQIFVRRLTKFKGLKHREYGAIYDCFEEINDTVEWLNKSVNELKSVGRGGSREFIWKMSNVQTWVSAALTDQSTCMDGFSGKIMDGKIKNSVRKWVTHVAQVTSNALALVNNFAARH